MPDLEAGPERRPPSAASPNAPVTSNMFAGESEAMQRLGANIQRAGGQLVNYGLRKDYLDYTEQFETGKIEYQNFLNKQEKARINDTHYSTHAINFDKASKSFTAEYLKTVKNSRAREELEDYYKVKGGSEELHIYARSQTARLRQIEERQPAMRDIYIDNWFDTKEENKDKIEDLRIKQLNEHVGPGAKTPEWVKQQRIEDAMAKGSRAISLQPNLAAEMLAKGGDINVLMSEREAELLDEPKRRYLRELASSRLNYINRTAKAELEAKQYDNEVKAYLAIKRGELTSPKEIDDMLERGEITLSANKSLHGYYKDGAADDDDNQALFDAGQIINRVKGGDLTAAGGFEELQKLATKLTDNTMDTKINQLSTAEKPDDILNDPVNKLYLKNMEEVIVGSGDDFDVSGMRLYEETRNAFESFLRENPDATESQKAEKYNALMEPHIKSWFKGLLEWLEWDEFKSEVAWVTGAGNRKKVTATKEKESKITKTATNPNTGKNMGWNGEKWVPIQ